MGSRKVHVVCSACKDTATLPKSLAGGVANCPRCGALIDVPGTPDAPIYWGVIFMLCLGVTAVAGAVVATTHSRPAGLAAPAPCGPLAAAGGGSGARTRP